MKIKTGLKQLLTRPVCGLNAGILMLGILAGSISAQTPSLHEDLKLLASDAAFRDRFGASISIDGDVAIVGADETGGITEPGSAYIFRFDGSTWAEEAKLFASDGEPTDGFARAGSSVSICGNVAIVGAARDDLDGDGFGEGSAYIFRYNGATWIEEAKLIASDGRAFDFFGASVSISGDVAVVSAHLDDNDNGNQSGSVYVYRFDPGSGAWVEETKLLASDGQPGDVFAESVSIDGYCILVGQSQSFSQEGSVYVYRFDPSSSTWIEEARLFASDGEVGDLFNRVSISGDVAIVGAWGDDDNGSFSGSAYIFRYDGSSWVEETKLVASDGTEDDRFGISVSLSGDIAVVGSPSGFGNNGVLTGTAYVYRYDGANWVETKLTSSDGEHGDQFGFSASVSGGVAIVGAYRSDDAGGSTGSAYIYEVLRDSDGDTLLDVDEISIHGTDPLNPDTDGDGLNDFTEVDTAVNGCPDPLNPDSDGDTLLDGAEVAIGTDPCNADSDGDGLPDNIDPMPLDPEITPGVLEDATRTLCAVIQALDLSLFNGPNDNANAGRRNALANRACSAANAIANDDIDGAIDDLASLLAKIDGDTPPPDWMDSSGAKTALASDVNTLIVLLLLEL